MKFILLLTMIFCNLLFANDVACTGIHRIDRLSTFHFQFVVKKLPNQNYNISISKDFETRDGDRVLYTNTQLSNLNCTFHEESKEVLNCFGDTSEQFVTSEIVEKTNLMLLPNGEITSMRNKLLLIRFKLPNSQKTEEVSFKTDGILLGDDEHLRYRCF